MADYVPLVQPGPYTATTSAAVTGGDVLVVSGNNTVAPSSAASAAFAGIAAFDAANGEKVTIHNGGVHELNSTGAINAGDVVMTAAGGDVAVFSGTTYSQAIGVALSAAASNKVKVRLFR